MDCSLPGFACLWNFPDKKTGVGSHFHLQGISSLGMERVSLASPALAGGFFTTGSPGNPSLLHVFPHIYIYIYFFFEMKVNGFLSGFCVIP